MQKVSAYARELYSIIEAAKKWRQYLFGAKFIIRTNKKSIKKTYATNYTYSRTIEIPS